VIASIWRVLVSDSMSQAAEEIAPSACPVIINDVSRHDVDEGSHCAVIYDRLGTLLQVVCCRGLCYAPRTLRGREENPGVQQQSGP
jgi:hypothetical protein